MIPKNNNDLKILEREREKKLNEIDRFNIKLLTMHIIIIRGKFPRAKMFRDKGQVKL